MVTMRRALILTLAAAGGSAGGVSGSHGFGPTDSVGFAEGPDTSTGASQPTSAATWSQTWVGTQTITDLASVTDTTSVVIGTTVTDGDTTSALVQTTTAASSPPVVTAALPYQLKTGPLDTPWTDKVGTNPWPQHPRPQLKRANWITLNGIWTWQPGDNTTDPGSSLPNQSVLANEVLIPSCLESAISGIMEANQTYSWFQTNFTVPSAWPAGNAVILNFDSVDYQSTIYVNGKVAGNNTGGYARISLDVTALLNPSGTNVINVFVFDPTDNDPYIIPVGKQTNHPDHIWYTPCTGIWQSVWLESAPSIRITQLDVSGSADGNLNITVNTNGAPSGTEVDLVLTNLDGTKLQAASGHSDQTFSFGVDGVQTWSPDTPVLYNFTVTMGNDTVSSYTGFRTVATGNVGGAQRPLLNGEFVFQFGTLDQGFWPDGIYTPPTYEAMVYDLQELKKLGFNMLRKHIKVENDLFYQACDQIGLMVFQDMPSMSPRVGQIGTSYGPMLPDPTQQAEFERQLTVMVETHKSFPCIVTWIIYNEGWGQITTPPYPEISIAETVRKIDPTRLIDATTGWFDHGAGDYSDNHHYASPQCGTPFYSINSPQFDPTRIGFQGEWGGIGENQTIDHLWNMPHAIEQINQTYELNADLASYNYRSHRLLGELAEQTELFACSGGIWTQTTDVEGEVNGLLTYDRRVERVNVTQWQADIKALYVAAQGRGGKKVT